MASMLDVVNLQHDELSSVGRGTGVPVRIRPGRSSSVSNERRLADADQTAAIYR
jgi:hypothetical protein